jgi:alpha-tubulin suppressor-like RCC1 family protein
VLILMFCLLLPVSTVLSIAGSEVSTSQIKKIDGRQGNILLNDGTLWSFKVDNGNATMDKVILENVIDVSNGYTQVLALKEDGTVWAWGGNWFGERGDDQYATLVNGQTPETRSEPIQLNGLTDVIAISAATRFSMALKSDGTVWTWGSNNMGGLGDGRRTIDSEPEGTLLISDGEQIISGRDRYQPEQIHTLSDIIAIDNFGQGGVALRKDGTVWGWSQYMGHLSPYQIPGFHGITSIQDTFAISDSGEVWGWGLNDRAQYGNGIRAEHTFFEIDPVPTRLFGLDQFEQIEVGITNTLGLKNGKLYSWGGNDNGSLGNGKSTARENNGSYWEIMIDHDRLSPAPIENLPEIQEVWATNLSSGGYALSTNGEIWSWGESTKGTYLPQPITFLNGPFTESENTPTKSDNSTPTTKPDNFTIIVNNKKLTFDQPPIEVKGRVKVPLRAIFDALHAEMIWDGKTSTVTAKKDSTIIMLTVGKSEATVNGKIITLDQSAEIVNNRILVPVRFVTESFGGTVDWDAATKTIMITTE